MKERPILFSGPMVRAVLEGRKTQTRRVVKLPCRRGVSSKDGWRPFDPELSGDRESMAYCSWIYGGVGDRLWVKETFTPRYFDDGSPGYRADWTERAADVVPEPTWKPSIFMPRNQSRITLEVTGVRVERLWDISQADAWAEGCTKYNDHPGRTYSSYWALDPGGGAPLADTPRDEFSDLWCSINGPDSWAANPWVWVVEFKRVAQEARAA
jgi:hypothetical protein